MLAACGQSEEGASLLAGWSMELSNGCKYVIDKLCENGFNAYAVGGCVRNSLMGISPKDYDVATNALPQDMQRVFAEERVITTGLKHGTITVLIDGEAIEATTFRADGEYSDCRHPQNVTFGVSLKEDLMRRDFTVNAMAYGKDGSIIDPFGGRNDLKNKLIRCVGEPDKRFGEDALRIMRALRFAAVYGFKIEESTAESIHKNKRLLNRIAVERIFSELSLLLCGKAAAEILLRFGDVLAVVIPEIEPCINLYLPRENHRQTLWEHITKAVDAVPPSLTLRLTMLLHDIAKPNCDVKEEKCICEQSSYHAVKSAEIAENVLKSLRAPSRLISQVTTLIKYHDYASFETEASIKTLMSKIGCENALLIFSEVRKADILAQIGYDRERRLKHTENCAAICKRLIEQNACVSIRQLAVNGGELLRLGYKGKEVGEMLSLLLNEVISGRLQNEKTALLEFAEKSI